MLKRIVLQGYSYKRFIIGFVVSFYALTMLSAQLIPFDYPTWSWLKVKEYQFKRQLITENHIVYILPLSIFIGVYLGLNIQWKGAMVRLLFILILVFAYVALWLYLSISDYVVNNYAL